MPVFNNAIVGAAGSGGADVGYKIERSLRFNPGDTPKLSLSHPVAGNRKTWTFSCWFKRTGTPSRDQILSAPTPARSNAYIEFQNDKLMFEEYGGGQAYIKVETNRVFRDPSAWYHVVIAVDTTQSTASDRVKIYVNGVQETSFATATYPSPNYETSINNNTEHKFSQFPGNSNFPFDGLLADCHMIDGLQLVPTDFGAFDETTGVWNPIEFAGTTQIELPGTVTPTLSNGAIIIKGVGGVQASGTITSSGGNLNFFASGNGINWTHVGTGTSHTYGGGDWLAAGGAGTSPRTFTTSGPDFKFAAWNTNTNFDQGSGHTTDVTGLTFSDPPTSAFGVNGFHFDFSDSSSDAALGTDSSGRNNNFAVTNISATGILYAGNAYDGSLNGYMPSGVAQATDPSQLASTSNRTHFFLVNQDNSINLTVVATATSMTVGSSVYDGWGANNPTTTLDNGTVTPNSSGTDSSVSGKNLATNTFTGLTVGNTYTISTKNGGAGNPHRIHYVTGATVQNKPIVDSDSLLDSPTSYDASTGNNVGNYATLNPLSQRTGSLSNGNLRYLASPDSSRNESTIAVTSGKYYWEALAVSNMQTHTIGGRIGICQSNAINISAAENVEFDVDWHANAGVKIRRAGQSAISAGSGTNYNDGDLIGVALDADNSIVKFYKNGTLAYTVDFSEYITPGSVPLAAHCWGYFSSTWEYNFGQYPFSQTIPTGYSTLCTQNLPDTEILDGSAHFTSALYTGSGGTTRIGGPVYSATSTLSNAGGAFDGNTGTGGVFNSTGNSILTAGSLTIESSLEIYHNRTGSDGITVNINGTDYAATGLSSAGYHTIPIPSSALPLTTTGNITIKDNQSGASSTVYAVRVDGIVVVDGTGIPTKFKPDLAWLKGRSHSRYHFQHDSVRGSTKALYSNRPDVEYDYGSSGVTKFHNDGLTVNGAYAANYLNETYVAWLWNSGNLATTTSNNQTQTWSDGWTGNSGTSGRVPTNAFDGDLTTWAFPGNNNANEYVEYSFTAIPVNTSLEFYLSFDSGGAQRGQLWVNDTNVTSQLGTGNAQWYTVTGQSTLSKIKILTTATNYYVNLHAVRVDGKMLVDPGIITVGSLNDTIYNTSQNWSVSGSNMQNNWSTSFDGKLSPTFALPNTGYSASMTFPSAITYQTLELVVSRDLYAPDLLVNGNNLNVPKTDTNQTGGRYRVERYYFTNGTLTSIGHEQRTTAGQGGSGFWQIIVDGKILVDTNQASGVPNVPSITTTCRSNPTAGFAISTYSGNSTSGASIAHNLGSTPEMVIVKARDKSDDWRVYHAAVGNEYYLRMQLGNYGRTTTGNWQEMSVNHFALDNDSAVNSSSYDYLAYSFSSVPGFSKFGSYTGAGSQLFINLGFRPAWVMIKRFTDNTVGEWGIYDSTRTPGNEIQKKLWANNESLEEDHPNNSIDFVSNGFVVDPGSDSPNVQYTNNGNVGYLYAAFAENPFKYARAR